MGFYSWETSDTHESISNSYSNRPTFEVAMIFPDNTRVIEKNYEGYGVFGGIDFYDKVAELNNLKDRNEAIEIDCSDEKHTLKLPRFARNLKANYDDLTESENCPDQGYFYWEDEDESDDYYYSEDY